MRISDWSSDVCSSDLHPRFALTPIQRRDGKTVGQHRHHQASPMSKLESLSGRALELAGSVGDTLRDRVPDRAMKWIETGAALGAVKAGSRVAAKFVRRNPAGGHRRGSCRDRVVK